MYPSEGRWEMPMVRYRRKVLALALGYGRPFNPSYDGAALRRYAVCTVVVP